MYTECVNEEKIFSDEYSGLNVKIDHQDEETPFLMNLPLTESGWRSLEQMKEIHIIIKKAISVQKRGVK